MYNANEVPCSFHYEELNFSGFNDITLACGILTLEG